MDKFTVDNTLGDGRCTGTLKGLSQTNRLTMRASLQQLFTLHGLLLACLVTFGTAPASAQLFADTPRQGATALPGSTSGPDFLPVEEAYQLAVDVEDNGNLRLYWQIADTYYLYRHSLAFDLTGSDGQIALEADLPPGLERTDEFFGDVSVYYNDADITLAPEGTPEQAVLTVVSQGCADAGLCYPPRTQYFALDFLTAAVTETTAAPPPRRQAVPDSRPARATVATLFYMLLLAFAGGIILNLMPCVFPILSLKVFAFARAEPRERHRHGWWYTAGVVLSFLLVATVLVALQQAGRAIGWGFQLQSPGFVIALAYLFIAMGLSLSGLIHLGGNLMNVGNNLAQQGGNAGSFFTGVLAVLVASPCTAPFMGTALGFALTQPPGIGLVVFAALGFGMASPLLLLSYSATARRLMPSPGAWMETLKQALAFPLYATALWLFWVAGRQTGVDTMSMAILGALLLALGMWLWGPGALRKGAAAVALLLAVMSAGWRGEPSAAAGQLADGRVAWSTAAVAEARAGGRPVFVDFTADWCITCLANERTVLHTREARERFASRDVIYMVADWTNYDAEIADFLAQMGRSGIPLYLLYPAERSAAPLVLPQILRKQHLVDALAQLPAMPSLSVP